MAKTIVEIPVEEAGRICKDVQLYFRGGNGWLKYYSPEIFREEEVRMPSMWVSLVFGIEVDDDKPEYSSDVE